MVNWCVREIQWRPGSHFSLPPPTFSESLGTRLHDHSEPLPPTSCCDTTGQGDEQAEDRLRCVCESQWPSLNDCLHIGPKFDQRIMDILLRFRTHRVAVIADIEKAFLMVSVTERDRDVLRFLWVDDITRDQPEITILRFARVVFGIIIVQPIPPQCYNSPSSRKTLVNSSTLDTEIVTGDLC